MYRAHEKPRHFHVIATQMNPIKLVNHLPHIFLGRPIRNADTYDAITQSMTVTPETSLLYTMDGDMYSANAPVRVAIGRTVEFLKV